jgi:hypothetical protein
MNPVSLFFLIPIKFKDNIRKANFHQFLEGGFREEKLEKWIATSLRIC